MSKRSLVFVLLVIMSSVLPVLSRAQDKPLGDVAREQRERQEARKKASPENNLTGQGSEVAKDKIPESLSAQPAPLEKTAGRSAVLDAPKDNEPDVFTIPAGTQIEVSVQDKKVTWPVRIGFATPIPALSKVTIQATEHCYQVAQRPWMTGRLLQCDKQYCLTGIILGGKTYPVAASSCATGDGTAKFDLAEPLVIDR